jgi:hypothetical protein
MIARLNRAAIGLYPMAFRNRYGDELRALIDDSPTGVLSLADLLRGALVAHVRPQSELTAALAPAVRIRLGLSGVLACWVAFAAAGFGFYKTTEGNSDSFSYGAHALLGGSHSLIQALAVIGSLAIIAGALPLVVMALRRALSDREKGVRGRLAKVMVAPLIAATLFTVMTGVLVAIANSSDSGTITAGGAGAYIAWAIAGVVTAGVCVFSARSALFCISADLGTLKRALWCATIATAGMLAIAISTAVYSVALSVSAPTLADTLDGPLQANSASISIDIQFAIMLTCALLACVSTRRAWRAAR